MAPSNQKLFIYILLVYSKLMLSPCLCVYVSSLFCMYEPIFMKLGIYIMAPESI
jgi:hypothetical protein